MRADVTTMVGGDDDNGVCQHISGLEVTHQPGELGIQLGHAAKVARACHAPLVVGHIVEDLPLAVIEVRAVGQVVVQIGGQWHRRHVIFFECLTADHERLIRFGEACAKAPRRVAFCELVQHVDGLIYGMSGITLARGHISHAIMQQAIVAIRPLDVPRERGIQRQVRAAVLAQTEESVMVSSLALVNLPAELAQIIRALDVPFAEVRGAIAARPQSLRPVGLLGAKHTLVRVAPMLHFQHTVIVRQQPGHQPGSCRRTGGRGCVRAVEGQSAGTKLVKGRRNTGATHLQGISLQAVHDEQENIGATAHTTAARSRAAVISASIFSSGLSGPRASV